MTKLTQATTKKLVDTVMSAYADFADKDAEIESHVIKACEAITKLVSANAIAQDVTPKNLGKMFFGDDYKGDKSKPTPQLNFVRRVVDRLRGAGVLVTPERKKSPAVSLPKLEQLKALARLDVAAMSEFADAVLFELTEKEIKSIVAALSACAA